MALITVRPTKVDKVVADEVSARTNPLLEKAAEVLSWGADEHFLCLAAGICWIATRRSQTARRELGNHVLACAVVASIVPHILKKLVDQERPDRRTLIGHLRGIPFSGKHYDAFPSGHAVHMGVVAGIASLLPARERYTLWSFAGILSATRVCLLAHWLSDVVVGLGVGLMLEKLVRPLMTGMRFKAADRRNRKSQAG